jgi:ribosome maturation factor RimP
MALDIEKIREVCDRVAGSMGLEIVDVEFRGGAGKQGRVLRITIDRPWLGPHEVPGANASMSDGSAAGNVAETSSPTPSPVVEAEGAGEPGGGMAESPSPNGSVHGVTLEDCANVSREVSTILDVEDVVPGTEYLLEVSSPGLDRSLSRAQDFERFLGSRVKVMTFQPVGANEKSKGNRHFEGKLERFADGKLQLDVNAPKRKQKPHGARKGGGGTGANVAPQLVEIDLKNVEKANLVPEF